MTQHIPGMHHPIDGTRDNRPPSWRKMRSKDYDDGRIARHNGEAFDDNATDDWKMGWLDERDRPSTPLEECA